MLFGRRRCGVGARRAGSAERGGRGACAGPHTWARRRREQPWARAERGGSAERPEPPPSKATASAAPRRRRRRSCWRRCGRGRAAGGLGRGLRSGAAGAAGGGGRGLGFPRGGAGRGPGRGAAPGGQEPSGAALPSSLLSRRRRRVAAPASRPRFRRGGAAPAPAPPALRARSCGGAGRDPCSPTLRGLPRSSCGALGRSPRTETCTGGQSDESESRMQGITDRKCWKRPSLAACRPSS